MKTILFSSKCEILQINGRNRGILTLQVSIDE
jgi:hypothetical protein